MKALLIYKKLKVSIYLFTTTKQSMILTIVLTTINIILTVLFFCKATFYSISYSIRYR